MGCRMVFAIKENNLLTGSRLSLMEVELAGVEPASKRGNHTLSTRLFQTLVFERWQDLDHQPTPYLLNFHTSIGA